MIDNIYPNDQVVEVLEEYEDMKQNGQTGRECDKRLQST